MKGDSKLQVREASPDPPYLHCALSYGGRHTGANCVNGLRSRNTPENMFAHCHINRAQDKLLSLLCCIPKIGRAAHGQRNRPAVIARGIEEDTEQSAIVYPLELRERGPLAHL
jgi:hypothetical protein